MHSYFLFLDSGSCLLLPSQLFQFVFHLWPLLYSHTLSIGPFPSSVTFFQVSPNITNKHKIKWSLLTSSFLLVITLALSSPSRTNFLNQIVCKFQLHVPSWTKKSLLYCNWAFTPIVLHKRPCKGQMTFMLQHIWQHTVLVFSGPFYAVHCLTLLKMLSSHDTTCVIFFPPLPLPPVNPSQYLGRFTYYPSIH